jgi:hypothetical protein
MNDPAGRREAIIDIDLQVSIINMYMERTIQNVLIRSALRTADLQTIDIKIVDIIESIF